MKPLTERERRFVEAFMGPAAGNATDAAKRAGYAKGSAAVTASRLLRKANVQDAIKERAEKAGITRERVLDELTLLAFSDLTHYTVNDSGDVELAQGAPKGAMRALQSIKRRKTTRGEGKDAYTTTEVEIRLWNKPEPLKLAGQHVGLFRDKVDVSGKLELSWAE